VTCRHDTVGPPYPRRRGVRLSFDSHVRLARSVAYERAFPSVYSKHPFGILMDSIAEPEAAAVATDAAAPAVPTPAERAAKAAADARTAMEAALSASEGDALARMDATVLAATKKHVNQAVKHLKTITDLVNDRDKPATTKTKHPFECDDDKPVKMSYVMDDPVDSDDDESDKDDGGDVSHDEDEDYKAPSGDDIASDDEDDDDDASDAATSDDDGEDDEPKPKKSKKTGKKMKKDKKDKKDTKGKTDKKKKKSDDERKRKTAKREGMEQKESARASLDALLASDSDDDAIKDEYKGLSYSNLKA